MWRRLFAVAVSVVALSVGWLSLSGLPLLVGLVPLLWISSEAEDSRKGWWSVFRLSLLTFVLWNITTVWWIWNATPVGPIAATIISSTLSMIAFMAFHTLSKRVHRGLSYTLLVSLWIALEYWYTMGSVSWPWLLLGNGFSADIWAIQWYEYTGLFGGSLWVLLTNILIFEAWRTKRRRVVLSAAAVAILPLALSAAIYFSYEEPTEGSIKVSVVQPNIHFERGDRPSDARIGENLIELTELVPADADFVVLPECAIPGYLYHENMSRSPIVHKLRNAVMQSAPDAAIVGGISSVKHYAEGDQTYTARQNGDIYYDIFNSALYIPTSGQKQLHHKAKLVVGTESMPFVWLFKPISSLIIDLGGSLGQLGRGTERVVFDDPAASVGAAICYEALYGAYYGEFVQRGAEAMFVISNDCWWDNTPGYRHLFAMSAVRAVEHRRAIARSANTGISGFISSRGDTLETMEWDERGVLTDSVALNDKITIYTRYGDYIARIAIFVAILSLLNYMVYRVRKRNHIV